jgi:hypothetical protein
MLEVEEENESCAAVDQSAHCAAAAFAEDDVAFPVAGDCTVLNLSGPLGDVYHAGQPGSAFDRPSFLRTARAGTQASSQLAARLASLLHEQRLAYGLVAHPHLRIVGEVQSRALRDLLRRPQLLQPRGDLVEQATGAELARLRTLRRLARSLLRVPRPSSHRGRR